MSKNFQYEKINLLFGAVINQAIIDIKNKSCRTDEYVAKIEAYYWITRMGKDFRFVCRLAGVDPEGIKKVVEDLKRMGVINLDPPIKNETEEEKERREKKAALRLEKQKNDERLAIETANRMKIRARIKAERDKLKTIAGIYRVLKKLLKPTKPSC